MTQVQSFAFQPSRRGRNKLVASSLQYSPTPSPSSNKKCDDACLLYQKSKRTRSMEVYVLGAEKEFC